MSINSLTMDKPVESSLLESGAQDVIGKPVDRFEGPLKTTGQATYAAEFPVENMAYGFLVRSTQGSGRVVSVDAAAVTSLPGVIDVITDYSTFLRNCGQGGDTKAPTQGVQDLAYFGEPIAIVVAESYEAARDAAIRLPVTYEAGEGRYDFEAHKDDTDVPPANNGMSAHFSQGDLDTAIVGAVHSIDVTYTTPSQNSAAMEPHASIAVWNDDGLTLYGSYQMLSSDRQQLAKALGEKTSRVRIVARYVGGGFGSKLGIAPETVAAAIAAKRIGRPVKAVMARQQVFDATLRRSNTEQRMRLAADAEGHITGYGHDTLTSNLPGENFFEPTGVSSHFLYAGENRQINHDQVRLNLTLAGSMRAPGEAAGMLAIEAAMDALAEQVGIDPVELRRRNEPSEDPEQHIPFSSRQLVRCLDVGAEKFGWAERSAVPGTRREGEWLIGQGVASAARSNKLMKSEAKVRVNAAGHATVETDMTDIGTGTYTILQQITAELLGLPLDRVTVKLGDTDFPPAAGSGGSWGAGSAGSAVYLACEAIRQQVAKKLGVDDDALTFKDGIVIADNKTTPIADLAIEPLEGHGQIKSGQQDKEVMQASYGAHFCEVGVNATTGEVRVRRFLCAVDGGRILNEKTARSQIIGGVTFGIGAALTEELLHDTRTGKLVNRDLAEYHVPVNADVPNIDVYFLPGFDNHANPIQAKGLGELGISGSGAAVINAIYNACGVRVTDYPASPDKILPYLPAM